MVVRDAWKFKYGIGLGRSEADILYSRNGRKDGRSTQWPGLVSIANALLSRFG